jgi:hypothetical protein
VANHLLLVSPLRQRFMFRTIHGVALMRGYEGARRAAGPTGGVIDRQSVKVPKAKIRSYDVLKTTIYRRRHIAVYADGRLLMVTSPQSTSPIAPARR